MNSTTLATTDHLKTFLKAADQDYHTVVPSDGAGIEATKRAMTFDDLIEDDLGHQADKVNVFVRIKPHTNEDGDDDDAKEEIVQIESDTVVSVTAPKESQAYKTTKTSDIAKLTHRFVFTKVFDPDISQVHFFKTMVLPRLDDLLRRQRNQLIFTYGATSSGKTFTIQGTPSLPGILPRSLDVIFNSIGHDRIVESADKMPLKPLGFDGYKTLLATSLASCHEEKETVIHLGRILQQQDDGTSLLNGDSGISNLSAQSLATMFPHLRNREKETSKIDLDNQSGLYYSVWISFAEIYNENIYDLLEKMPLPKNKEKPRRSPLKLAEDKRGSVYIKGLKEIHVNSPDEAFQLLMIGRENLQFAATKLNHNSSRSHCIFTIKLICAPDMNRPKVARVNILSFCDLAGSERIKKTLNTGARQKEAGNINTSLLVLGRCMKALRDNQTIKDVKKQQIVPFRDSKLTRLFQTFFTGQGKSSMIVNVSKAPILFDETLHVMKFAAITSKVTCIKESIPQSRRQSRFSSIMYGHLNRQTNMALAGRGSIAWENPSVRSTMCPPSIEEGEKNTSISSTNRDTCYFALTDLIEELQTELANEKQRNLTLENDIRTELCAEFSTMMVNVEQEWQKRLQETTDRLDDLSEWRISKMESAYRESRKRKRQHDEDDEYKDRIARLETEMNEKELLLRDAEKQSKALKETHKNMVEVQNKQQEELSSLKFEKETLKKTIKDLEDDLKSSKAECKSKDSALESLNTDPIIQDLQQQMSDMKQKLDTKNEEITDLKKLLDEAGEEFLAKDDEVSKLSDKLASAEMELAQQSLTLKDAQDEAAALLSESNARLEENEQLEEQLVTSKKEKTALLAEKANLLLEITKLKEEKLSSAQKLERDVFLSDSKETEKELERRIQELEESNRVLKENLETLKDKSESEVDELKSTLQNAMDTSEILLAKNGKLKSKLNEAEKKLKKLDRVGDVSVLETREFEKAEERLLLNEELEAKENELARLRKEFEELSINLEGSIDSLKKEVATKETYIRDLEAIIVDKDYKITETENMLNDTEKKILENENAKEKLFSNSEEISDLLNKISNMEKSKEELERSLKKVEDDRDRREKDLNDEIESLRQSKLKIKNSDDLKTKSLLEKEKEISNLEREVKSLIQAEKSQRDAVSDHMSEVKMLRAQIKKLSEESNDTEVLGKKIAEQQCTIENLKLQLKSQQQEENVLEILKKELEFKNQEKVKLTEKISELETNAHDGLFIHELKEKTAVLQAELEAKDYEIKKTREEREDAMTRYSKLLKSQSEELTREKQETKKLRDVMLKSTPSKKEQQGELQQLKDELERKTTLIKNLEEKLRRCESDDEMDNLRDDVERLQRDLHNVNAAHTRELTNLKKANDKIIKEYKEANLELQRQVGICGGNETSHMSIFEPDESVRTTDTSMNQSTPGKNRRRGRGNRNRRVNASTNSISSPAASATFDDSNLENKGSESSAQKVSKSARVTRSRPVRKTKKNVSYVESGERSALKEINATIDESPENKTTPNETRKSSRRQLYTPGNSEVFSPSVDGDSQAETPHTIVRRQLRTRRKK